METLKIAGLILDYMKPGEQKYDFPLLFVHGMWGGSWYWLNFMNYFSSNGFECYAVNLRGHWGSRPVSNIGKVSVLDYVSDVREVIENLKASPVVIGHSMGGLIAQKIAFKRGRIFGEAVNPCATALSPVGGIKAAVLICPAPPKGIRLTGSLSLMIGQMRYLPHLLLKKPLRPSYKLAVKTMLGCLDEADRLRVYDKMIPDSGLAAREMSCGKIEIDETAVPCPMLVISSLKDNITPAKVVAKVASKYQAELKEYPNHAHWIVEEEGWEQVASDVKEWIEVKVK